MWARTLEDAMGMIFVSGCLCCVTCAQAVAPERDVKSEPILRQLQEVAELSGEAYFRARRNLDRVASQDIETFKRTAEKARGWRVPLLVRIVAERVQKRKAVARLLKAEPKPLSGQRGWDRVVFFGEALAEAGKDVPMLLIEKLWKDTEIKTWPRPVDDIGKDYDIKIWPRSLNDRRRIFTAWALGVLKPKASRPVLEEALDSDDDNVKDAALWALGELGDSRSVPTLFRFIENYPRGYSHLVDIAADSLLKCGGRECVGFLEEKARVTENPRAKAVAKRLIDQIHAEQRKRE